MVSFFESQAGAVMFIARAGCGTNIGNMAAIEAVMQ